MMIIDKRKDYYDYLQGVFGQDPKAVYDRRGGICMTKDNMPYFFQTTIPPDVDGYMGIVHLFCGNIVYAFFFENYGEGISAELILSKRIKRTTIIPMRMVISTDTWKEVSNNRLSSKYNTRTERKKQIIRTEERRSKWKDYKDGESAVRTICKKPTELYDNPILVSFPLPIIPAEELFLNLQEFILSLNDKPILDNRTDKQKLEAAGFDYKTSFRKM